MPIALEAEDASLSEKLGALESRLATETGALDARFYDWGDGVLAHLDQAAVEIVSLVVILPFER